MRQKKRAVVHHLNLQNIHQHLMTGEKNSRKNNQHKTTHNQGEVELQRKNSTSGSSFVGALSFGALSSFRFLVSSCKSSPLEHFMKNNILVYISMIVLDCNYTLNVSTVILRVYN